MAAKQFQAAAVAASLFLLQPGAALAEPAAKLCTATFTQTGGTGAFASGDLKDGGLQRLYVEMGPTRSALVTKGPGIASGYKTATPELTYWNYMSIYQPAKEWLTPGSVRMDYSGFRIGWPEFRAGGKVVKNLKLTITQGDQSMTIDVGPDANGAVISSRVIAIDFEAMLPGATPAVRVPDHQAWRTAEGQKRTMTITLADAKTGKVMARGDVAPLTGEPAQALLSGGLNALRDKFKAWKCG